MMKHDYDRLTSQIIHSAIEVHQLLGPGLMESVYDHCLYTELLAKNLTVERQKLLPVIYKGEVLNKEFVIDQLVEDIIILELKSVEAQLVTYLKLAEKKLGLLINFNVPVLKSGIRRKINGNLNHI